MFVVDLLDLLADAAVLLIFNLSPAPPSDERNENEESSAFPAPYVTTSASPNSPTPRTACSCTLRSYQSALSDNDSNMFHSSTSLILSLSPNNSSFAHFSEEDAHSLQEDVTHSGRQLANAKATLDQAT
ncbi:hypothetical protein ERJ75_000259100 [Trypanosoma vivax]|nr:hypothetical protein TRVL_00650 [Trypanosoma vivax]KAH8618732.1 hypothetical protein ERJ75_000259100 [Trypanosoma vivax]